MTFDVWTLGFQAVNVLVLIWLLDRLFWKPVAALIAARQAAAATLLDDAGTRRREAEAAAAEVAATRAGLAAERDAMLATARTTAEADREALLAAARAEAAALEDTARAARLRAAERLKATALDDAQGLAITIAGRLAARLDGPATDAAFLGWLVEGLDALSDAERSALAEAELELVSATDQDGSAQERIAAAVAEALGTPVALTFRSDPALIAGFELGSPHFGLHNSWRADLARIAAAMGGRAICPMPHDVPGLSEAAARVRSTVLGPMAEHLGRVEEIADGVAMISGLPDVRLDELLRFDAGAFGFAQVLEPDRIGCVLLDASRALRAGDIVRGTGDVVRVPVGPGLLGRIVDPLGRPLDRKGPIEAAATLPVEREAPGIIERDLVTDPVQTGVLVVDTLFALGRGQRELIIGDPATGKTTLAVDAIIAQRDTDMVCIYVAVGQRTSAVRRAVDALQTHAAFDRCIVVVAGPATPPGLQWIAPFAGMTMAEHFRDSGGHALIVIDDLSKHAATHREIALLTRQSPGREAYPGDVFHVHARLLERAARLSPARGGGSLTALPIAQTEAGNLSAYIPTNLISITDGQIVLDARLFQEGQKPAVDVGLSVSRVGGKTQAPALREAAKSLRLDYAQFLEMEVFTRFGGTIEPRVKAQLTRGARLRAVLCQDQHRPMRLGAEVALVLAVQEGLLDGLAPDLLAGFRDRLAGALEAGAAATLRQLGATGTLDEADRAALLAVLRRLADADV